MSEFVSIEVDEQYVRWADTYISHTDLNIPAAPGDLSTEARLAWERKSKRIYWAALVARLCGKNEFAARALEALSEWPSWRPENDDGIDANNWSNGYLPGAWGLLGGDRETFEKKGDLSPLPGAAHWKLRSTNHGIAIMASYLVGARAIGADQVCREDLREVVKWSLGDGCYPEGVNYLSFILEELAVYLRLGWDGSPWRAYVERELPGISGAKEMLCRSMGRDDRIFVAFGDLQGDPLLWRNGMSFADSLSDQGDLRPAIEANDLHDDPPLEPFVRGLPAGGRPLDWGARDFGMGMAHYRDRKTFLWIIGSNIHKTHNVDHDRGSFFFQQEGTSVGEGRGRQAYHHNVILLKDAPDFPDCQGAMPFVERQLNGTLARIGRRSWRVDAPRAYRGYPSTIDVHIREFHLIDGGLLIVDRLKVSGDGEPVMHFNTENLQSLWGHSTENGRAFVSMRKMDGDWVGAAVLGARLSAEGEKLVFRGQKRKFPAFEVAANR